MKGAVSLLLFFHKNTAKSNDWDVHAMTAQPGKAV